MYYFFAPYSPSSSQSGKPVNSETIEKFAWDTLNAGKVIPG